MPFSGKQIFWIMVIAAVTPRVVDAIMPKKAIAAPPSNGG